MRTHLFPIGSSPTIMTMEDLQKIVPVWYELSLEVHEDDEAVEAWGWIQEMYAFTMAMFKAGVHNCGLEPNMMAQPPWDWDMQRYYLLHYTYGMDYTKEGVFTPGKIGEWRFDKRSWGDMPISRNLEAPPEGMKNGLVRHLINVFNEATDAIPMWDTYAKTGRVSGKEMIWDGTFGNGTSSLI